MITRSHAAPLLGQHVVIRTHDGVVHHGILHSATNDGVYLRAVNGGRTQLTGGTDGQTAVLLDNAVQGETDVEQTWFPFFFFPFLALAWLGPWAWWW